MTNSMNSTDSSVPSHDTPRMSHPAGFDAPGVTAGSHAPGKTETAESGSTATLLGDGITGLIGTIARYLDAAFVEQSMLLARKAGHYAVFGGAALTLLYAIVVAIRQNSFAAFLAGLLMVVAIAVAQFTAQRFLHAADGAILHTPSNVSSHAFLDSTGLLALLLALAALLGGIVSSIQLSSVVPLVPALFMAIVLTYVGAVALHPELVNVSLAETSAGDEAVGLLSFLIKTGIKVVPVVFCLLAIGGCLAVIASFFQSGTALAETISAVLNRIPVPVALPYGLAAAGVVAFAALVPLFAYFSFVLQYLMLDLCRAVLAIPGKLDLLRR